MIKLKKLNNTRFFQYSLAFLFTVLLLKLVIEIMFLCTPIANHIGQIHTDTSYNDLIEIKGNASDIVIRYTINKIGNVPNNIVQSFLDDGGKVYITNSNLNSLKTENANENRFNTAGFFRHSTEEISIWLSTLLFNSYSGTAEHEFGHYLDWKLNWISSTDEFSLVMESEKEAFKKHINSNEYFQSNEEYFSESFSVYCVNPEKLKSYCPMTYDIIKRAIESIE